MNKVIFAAAAAVALSGCATVFDSGDKFTRITSDVSPVRFEVRNSDGELVGAGETPEYVRLDPDAGLFSRETFTVKASGPNGPMEGEFRSQFNHTTWWSNVIPIYGLSGQLIDWMSGSIWTVPESFELQSSLSQPEAPPLQDATLALDNDDESTIQGVSKDKQAELEKEANKLRNRIMSTLPF